jgi:hypothetical protein
LLLRRASASTLIIAFAIAWLLRGKLTAGTLSTFVGNPATYPLIWASTSEIGRAILGSGAAPEWLGRGFAHQSLQQILPLNEPMLLGLDPARTRYRLHGLFHCLQGGPRLPGCPPRAACRKARCGAGGEQGRARHGGRQGVTMPRASVGLEESVRTMRALMYEARAELGIAAE